MAKKQGKFCKIALGSDKVVGTANFTIPGVNWEKLDSSEMGDEIKGFMLGMGDSPVIPFSGLWDPADTTGLAAMRAANLSGTALTTALHFFVDATSYWTASTTNPASTVYVTKFDVKEDKSALHQFDAEISVSGGKMILV